MTLSGLESYLSKHVRYDMTYNIWRNASNMIRYVAAQQLELHYNDMMQAAHNLSKESLWIFDAGLDS